MSLMAHSHILYLLAMKKFVTTVLALCSMCVVVLAQDIYLQEAFEKGIPSGFTVWDKDENPTQAGLQKVSFASGSWSSALIGSSSNRSAVSSSYSTYNYPVEDWLITPQVHIASAAVCLRWDAKSVHYDLRDGYKVMISEGGMKPSDFVELFSIDEEDYFWKTRILSLAKYEGKDVYIAFVHNSVQRFMLAIDNLTVGELSAPVYGAVNNTPVSAKGGGNVGICGSICNLSSLHSFYPVCVADGVLYEYDYGEFPSFLHQPGDTVDFNFNVPTPAEGKLVYKVGACCEADTSWLITDTVYCSAFARKLLVEEYTATWCTSCPEGTQMMHEYEHRLRDCIIPVVAHNDFNDVMGDANYSAGMNYWLPAFPSFLYDRYTKSQSASYDGHIYEALSRPVQAEIEITDANVVDGKVNIKTIARFAETLDNSSDLYRMAYIVTENVVHRDTSTYKQSNNCTLPKNGEYYFFPSSVPPSLMFYHDVARGISTAFTGVPQLLPQESLAEGVDYPVDYQFDMPSSVIDPHNVSVTAVIVTTKSRALLAACRATDLNYSGNVPESLRNNGCPCSVSADNGSVVVDLNEGQAEVCVYAVDGRLVARMKGTGMLRIPVGSYKGVAIVAVLSETGNSYRKIVINH